MIPISHIPLTFCTSPDLVKMMFPSWVTVSSPKKRTGSKPKKTRLLFELEKNFKVDGFDSPIQKIKRF
jgi:hypothetical protein